MLVAGGRLWLVDACGVEAGGLWLDGGWWLVAGRRLWLVDGGGWRLEDGCLCMEDGGWWMVEAGVRGGGRVSMRGWCTY